MDSQLVNVEKSEKIETVNYAVKIIEDAEREESIVLTWLM